MSVNPYFNNFSHTREQDLLESIIIESIKMYGMNMKYIPRTIVEEDTLYGEASLSRFEAATDLEMYIKNVEGFGGEGDFLSKFNLEIRDSITFTVARKRFDQARTEKLITENGYNIILESGNSKEPSRQFLSTPYEGNSVKLEDGNGQGYTITNNRPTEGDLIFFPLSEKLYEITHVEHEEIFYQAGRLQTYDLKCELFEYSSEELNTGIDDIDSIEDKYSLDVSFNQLLLENGSGLLLETGDYLLVEYEVAEKGDFSDFSDRGNDVLNFSESNPFGEIDRY